MSGNNRHSQSFGRLSLERLEAREVPASYALSFTVAPTMNTVAQIHGYLHLNSAYPSLPSGRILLDADTPVEAVRKGLFGRIGVHFSSFKTFYDYGMASTSATAADHKPFLIEPFEDVNGGTHRVKLEDLAGLGPHNNPNEPDWDYDDQVWSVRVLDINAPPPPPGPGGVQVAVPLLPEPKLEVLDKNNAGMTDLKVGKWSDAFNANGANAVTLKANFIDDDPDRYKLRLTDLEGKDANQVKFTENNTEDTVRVSVNSSGDTGNEVTLTETGVNTGVFVSKYLLLVSNEVDDMHVVDGKSDNTLDDRTLSTWLDGSIYLYYFKGDQTISKRSPVRVIKTVSVHITVMTNKKVGDPGAGNHEVDGYATNAHVNEWMTKANEQYAQIGVRLQWSTQFADQPTGVDLSVNGLSEYKIQWCSGDHAGREGPDPWKLCEWQLPPHRFDW